MVLLLVCDKNEDAVDVLLVDGGVEAGRTRVLFTSGESQDLLPSIVDLVESHNHAIGDLGSIVVVHGAQRFTVSRLVVVIANGLAWSLQVPLAGVDAMPDLSTVASLATNREPLEAVYSKEPTIG